jgi:hypothetical protein
VNALTPSLCDAISDGSSVGLALLTAAGIGLPISAAPTNPMTNPCAERRNDRSAAIDRTPAAEDRGVGGAVRRQSGAEAKRLIAALTSPNGPTAPADLNGGVNGRVDASEWSLSPQAAIDDWHDSLSR